MKSVNYRTVRTIKDIDNYLDLHNNAVVSFDLETSPIDKYKFEDKAALDSNKAKIVGISLSVEEGTAIYVPLEHNTGENIDDFRKVMDYLVKEIFQMDDIIKVCHNISYESAMLSSYGITLVPPFFDTICASQLTLKNETKFRELKDSGLKTLVPEFFNITLPSFSDTVGHMNFGDLNPDDYKTIHYACADADYTLRLYRVFTSWFKKYIPKHLYICEAIESPTAVYVGLMKHNGICVDTNLIYSKQKEANDKLSDLKNKINNFAGRELNIGVNASTNDLKSFLYDELNLPVLKTTSKLQEAADDEAFIRLKDWCKLNKPYVVEFLETIQEYRKWSKLKSTYIDGLIKHINTATNKIHTDLFQLSTDTGRFSSRNPNLQNLPRKNNDPIGVRNFFKPSPGYVFLDFDFSQIELRVGAYICKDKRMLRTYETDGDIHGITTSLIYNISLEEAMNKNHALYKERRTIAKNCNFGVFFGLFSKGLQRTLKFKAGIEKSEEQCKQIIENIRRGYPSLVRWQNETKKIAAIRRYSETPLGRRRMLQGINSDEWSVSSYWERCALNTPIQGCAADILKIAMSRILEGLNERPYIRPLLQIHDELLFEVREDKIYEAAEFIKSTMEMKPFKDFNVPIKVEGEFGYSFGEMRELR